MISILIPCYDHNAYPLVSILEKQALMLKIDFEIICIDDGSFSSKNDINQKINLLTNSKFIESKKTSEELIIDYYLRKNPNMSG